MENNQKKNKKTSIPRHMGKVTRWDNKRKFGFVRCFDDGVSYFIHVSQCSEEGILYPGSTVEFEIWTDKTDTEQKFAAKLLVCEAP